MLEDTRTWMQFQIGSLREDILIQMLPLKTNSNRQHVSALLLAPNMLKAPKIGSTTRGIPALSGPWLAAPYLFGIAGPTGDNGTSFPI